MKAQITQVEIHLSHACNFMCESCSHFSQDGHKGNITVEQFINEVEPWTARLQPKYVLLLGGEPLLNPNLNQLLDLSRKLWKEQVIIILVTNGWLIPRRPNLAGVLRNNNIRCDISIHSEDPNYLTRIHSIGRELWNKGVKGKYRNSYKKWTYIYRGSGADVLPYDDNNRESSWYHCVSKWCMQIHEGKLWKCPPIAYLPMQMEKFGIDKEGPWKTYLKYQPLEPDCSDEELFEFTSRKAEQICEMCPANPQVFKKPMPVRELQQLEMKNETT